MREVVIVGAARTPIGKFGGALAACSAVDLGIVAVDAALERAGVAKDAVDQLIFGNVLQAGLGQNPARQVVVRGGFPIEVPAFTVNAVCGSGLLAVNQAADQIALGHADVIVAGGMESMSNAPYLLDKARFGYRMNDGKIVDSMVHDALWDIYGDYHMGITAENIAEEYGITREMQDHFAAVSQQKCEAARAAHLFDAEIAPVTIKGRKGDVVVDADEGPRDGVTDESIAKLRPAFTPDGTVTAANASSINDGAAAVVLMSREKAEELGIKPIASYIIGTSVGCDPATMGLGAGKAAVAAMEKAGLTVDDLAVIEANEAFASQSIASAKIAGWNDPVGTPADMLEKVNPHGGAIALGHPVGASGCRILVTLLYELARRAGRAENEGRALTGLATLCVGGGMGVAAIVRR